MVENPYSDKDGTQCHYKVWYNSIMESVGRNVRTFFIGCPPKKVRMWECIRILEGTMDKGTAIKHLMDLIDEAKNAEEIAQLKHKEQEARLQMLYEIWDVLLNGESKPDHGN